MSSSCADREILFGLLAVQNGMVAPSTLVETVQAWTLDRDRPLAEHLVAAGGLDEGDRTVLDTLVARQLEKHGGSAERSLATIPAGPSTLESLAGVDDADVAATIGHLSTSATMTHDAQAGANATYSIGTAAGDGQRFGILRPHARGGLGAVFLALDAELHREVALKQILEKHADDPTARARFLLEAEVTGGLEHPGIVPVYGLGMYADGRPYYAMRFIRGDSFKEAIDRFHADPALRSDPGRRSLELRKLLRRFTDVCNAIDYAHSRGVIHRDIKPANVVLGRHGETLVVDWGLAKVQGRTDFGAASDESALVPRSSSGSAETLPGRSMGTPSFMSPEQAEGDLENLGPRSDVYSLGATLYNLLTGRQPFDGNLTAVLRAVKQGDFLPPRQVDPTIDRALEAVCKQAMALNPGDRYASPRALAEDVERWMADEPVSAWREPLARRARRWAKQNRTKVTAAAVALLAGVIGLSAVLVVQTQAKADIARALANETKASRALAGANEGLARSKAAVQARYELAVDAVKTFHTGVSEDFLLKEEKFKALRDRLLRSASDFYGKLGALLGKETDLASRRALAAANFELAGLTAMVGRNADALAAHRSVLRARRELAAAPGADASAHADVGRSLTEVAGLLESAGKTDEALAAYREAEGALSGPAAGSPQARAALADCRSRMGFFLTTIGKDNQALAVYRLARADQEKLATPSGATLEARRDLGDTVNRIGRLLANTGRPREAEAEYRAALAIRKELADKDPAVAELRNSLAATHNNLGIVLLKTGRPKEAEAEYRTALAIRAKLAEDNPAVTEFRKQLQASHFNLGNLLRQTGRSPAAEALFRAAVSIQQELAEDNPTLPEFRRLLAINHQYLGTVLKETGRPREAEPEYRTAQSILQKLVATNPAITSYRSDLGSTYTDLGVLLAESGRSREAEAEFRAGVSNERMLAEANPAVTEFRDRLATGHVNLGELLSETGRPSEAEPEYHAAQTLFRGLAEANPAVTYYRFGLAYTQVRRGLLLSQAGRPSEAESEDRAAAAIYQDLADHNPKVPQYRDGLATALTNMGDVLGRCARLAEAREAHDRAIALRERLVTEHPKAASFRGNLASALRRRGLARRDLGDAAGAAADSRRALAILDGRASRSRLDWYETACCHAALAGLAGSGASGVSAGDGPAGADRAMDGLRRAVAMGYRDRDAIRTESALDPLRNRPDFRLLWMDLAMPAEVFAQ